MEPNETQPEVELDGRARVTMTEARRSWDRLIKTVVDTGTPAILTRYGKPIALLAPYRPRAQGPLETPAQADHRLTSARQRGHELLETGIQNDNPDPIHPGEILQREFLSDLGISWQTLAASSGIPMHDIISIVSRRQTITPDVAAAFGRSLGTTAEFWLNLQREYDRRISKIME